MDLLKAFDRMKIVLLTSKLGGYGMHDSATRLLAGYLTERTQSVR